MNYKTEAKKFRDQFDKKISKSNKILITSHNNPDDDSISSVLGVYYYLKSNFADKNVDVIYKENFVNRWNGFTNFGKIERRDIDVNIYDTVILVDANQWSRGGLVNEDISKSNASKICIDHHESPPDDFDLSLIIPSATSCAEVIYYTFFDENNLTEDAAEIILLGIIGDTGTFNYVSYSQSHIFDVIKKLVEAARINDIQLFTTRFRGYSEEVFTILSKLMLNVTIVDIDGWPKCLVSYLEIDLLEKYDGDTLSIAAHIFIAQYGKSIEGVDWGMIFYPKSESELKVSLRSLPKVVNVRKVVEKIGIGGGHDNASGGKYIIADNSRTKKVEEFMEFVLNSIRDMKYENYKE